MRLEAIVITIPHTSRCEASTSKRSDLNALKYILVNFIFRDIVFAFLDDHFIAMGNLIADPLGDVFGGRIEVHHIVYVLVVQLSGDGLLGSLEIDDHTVRV